MNTVNGTDKCYEAFKKYKYPKLKSLTVPKARHLQWIYHKKVDKLAISELSRYDVEHFDCSTIKLRELQILSMNRNYTGAELSQFIDRNPSIERLEFNDDFKHHIPRDFFAKLPNLKHLRLTLGKPNHYKDLKYALKINNLTELTLQMKDDYRLRYFMESFDIGRYLRKLIEKNTVNTLSLEGLCVNDYMVNSLSSTALISLRVIKGCFYVGNDLYKTLANTSLSALQDLNIVLPARIKSTFVLITNFTTLERLTIGMFEPYSRDTLMDQLYQLLQVRSSTRPELVLNVAVPSLSVKVNLNLH